MRFYDDLLQLLARRRIHRPAHLTPREFASSLSFLPSDLYTRIADVTELFYRVRYGNEAMEAKRRREVSATIAEIAVGLGQSS